MEEELEMLNEWQTRLGLNDWFILMETHVKPNDMSVSDSDGCVLYQETVKSAKIQIVDPDNRLETEEEEKIVTLKPFNFETTLVHELLHLKFCLLERGEKWEKKLQLRLLHQILDDLAKALVDAKYSKLLSPVEPTKKDENHWYCGRCGKRIRLKSKPKYCCKCGAKIGGKENVE